MTQFNALFSRQKSTFNVFKKQFREICSSHIISNWYEQGIFDHSACNSKNTVIFLIIFEWRRKVCNSIKTNFFERRIPHIGWNRKRLQLTVELMMMNSFALTNWADSNVGMYILSNAVSSEMTSNQFKSLEILNSLLMRHKNMACNHQGSILDDRIALQHSLWCQS